MEILCKNTDSTVLGVNYCLAPDYSALCQLEDVLAHILYLTSPVEESGIRLCFDQIIVFGDSAGGDLSSILDHFMRDTDIDLKTVRPSNDECLHIDFISSFNNATLTRDEKGDIAPDTMLEREHHLAPIKYLNSPLVSPLCDTNFRDLPPILIISGEIELIMDESYLYQGLISSSYAQKELVEFKLPPSTLHLYQEMLHVFPLMLPELLSSKISAKRASNFINQCFGKNSSNFAQSRDKYPINEDIREIETTVKGLKSGRIYTCQLSKIKN